MGKHRSGQRARCDWMRPPTQPPAPGPLRTHNTHLSLAQNPRSDAPGRALREQRDPCSPLSRNSSYTTDVLPLRLCPSRGTWDADSSDKSKARHKPLALSSQNLNASFNREEAMLWNAKSSDTMWVKVLSWKQLQVGLLCRECGICAHLGHGYLLHHEPARRNSENRRSPQEKDGNGLERYLSVSRLPLCARSSPITNPARATMRPRACLH